jgi:site-specific DNA-adenine methylase
VISYYGSKSKVVKHYPPPEHNLIIEPFAGSARYSLLYCEGRKVILNDIYTNITDIWNYLVQATPEQIMNLPEMKRGDDLRNFDLPPAERNLMSFIVTRGNSGPRNLYSEWAAKSDEIGKFKERAIRYLDKVRDFKILNEDYRKIDDYEATWYIDPPYVDGGSKYPHSKIDYRELAEWCRTRKGQVIVCEHADADWLPFKPLVIERGMKKTKKKVSMELIWTNY